MIKTNPDSKAAHIFGHHQQITALLPTWSSCCAVYCAYSDLVSMSPRWMVLQECDWCTPQQPRSRVPADTELPGKRTFCSLKARQINSWFLTCPKLRAPKLLILRALLLQWKTSTGYLLAQAATSIKTQERRLGSQASKQRDLKKNKPVEEQTARGQGNWDLEVTEVWTNCYSAIFYFDFSQL